MYSGFANDEITAARYRDIYIIDNLSDSHFKLNFIWSPDEITTWKNKFNSRKQPSSKYIGVRYQKRRNNWLASITINGKLVYYRVDSSELKAARYYDLFIMKNLPNKSKKLNFNWLPQDIIEWEDKLKSETPRIVRNINKINNESVNNNSNEQYISTDENPDYESDDDTNSIYSDENSDNESNYYDNSYYQPSDELLEKLSNFLITGPSKEEYEKIMDEVEQNMNKELNDELWSHYSKFDSNYFMDNPPDNDKIYCEDE